MRTAFIDCQAGAAGDMLLGALVDAGAPPEDIHAALEQLDVGGWELGFEEISRSGLRGLKAVVSTNDDAARTYSDIVTLLEDSELDNSVATRALDTFEVLGRAEANVHGRALDDVHLHEVGAVDAIVDIVGCCVAIESLQLERIVVSPIATGAGTIRTQHGEMPLPAPAVAEIIKGSGATLYSRGTRELVTPTGAALLVAAANDHGPMPPMSVDAVGVGAGEAELEFPNVVRVFRGEAVDAAAGQTIDLVIETNLDDTNPELLPYVIDKLLAAGARDAWITPIVMKKGRPAFTLSVLCAPELEPEVAAILFRETTTLGIRAHPVHRRALEREWMDTDVAGTRVRVKIGRHDGEIVSAAPEHDDAVAAAEKSGLPLKEIYARATEAARTKDQL